MMKKTIAAITLAVSGTTAFASGIPVFDGAAQGQWMLQMASMAKQLAEMKKQYDQLKQQYEAVTGSYGVGNTLINKTMEAANIVPGSWQDIVKQQQGGQFKGKVDYYETLMKSVDPNIFANDKSRTGKAYQLSYDNTRAAFAVTDATYDAVEIHKKNIEQLMQRIDSAQNIKEATDLSNRINAENAMLQIAMARLSTVQNNLNATMQNEKIQSQATRSEMLRYDPNYQYKVNKK